MAFPMPSSSFVTPAVAGEPASAKICTPVQVMLFIYIGNYSSRSKSNDTNDCWSKGDSSEITTQIMSTGCIGSD